MVTPFTAIDIYREAFPEAYPVSAHSVAFRSGAMMCLERLALYEITGTWQVPLSNYEPNSILSHAFDAGVTYGHQLYERATHCP